MANTSFYSPEELSELGLNTYGENVLISRRASIYSPEKISIGSNVRVDDFCILSGKIQLGNYIHIAAYSALYGAEDGIYIDDYAGLSSRVSIYAASDDYSGAGMTNPMIDEQYRNVISAPVKIGKYVNIGATCVVMPGVTLKEGSAFGNFSYINKDAESWTINAGVPATKKATRLKHILDLEKEFKKATNDGVAKIK